MKYEIGDLVIDEDQNKGIVCIKWNDGDICALENDAAHPNPVVVGHWPLRDEPEIDKNRIIEILKQEIKSHPSVWGSDICKTLGYWKQADKPFVWEIMDRIDDYLFLSDSGYGKFILIKDYKIMSVGNNFVVSHDKTIIGLSEYYGVDKPKLYKVANKD